MTDKVQKIREEVEIVVNRRLNLLNGDYFNLNEETDGLTNEIMYIIDSLQEEHVSEKKCMFTKDSYTDEDRKVLCDGCEEECEYAQKEEPVSKVYTFKAIPRLLDMIQPSDRAKTYITKLADSLDEQGYHTDAKIVRESIKIMNGEKVAMATMDEESVSEELGEYINELSKQFPEVSFAKLSRIAVRVAKWQKEQMMAKAIDGKVLVNGMGNPILHLWDKGKHLIDKKVKVIIIKED